MSNPYNNKNKEDRPIPAINRFIEIDGIRYLEITEAHIDNVMPGQFINDQGVVYDTNTGNFKHPVLTDRYTKIRLRLKDGSTYDTGVHRLLMLVFNYIRGCEKLCVNHIDGNKRNNSFDNLEWCTQKENIRHAVDTGLIAVGEARHTSNLTEKEVREICKALSVEHRPYGLYTDLANKYNVAPSTIADIATGRSWPSVTKEYGLDYSIQGTKTVADEKTVRAICEDLSKGRYRGQIEALAKKYNLSRQIVSQIVQRKNWTHISDEYDFAETDLKRFTDEEIHVICQTMQEYGKLDNEVFDVLSSKLNTKMDYPTRQYLYKVYHRKYRKSISDQYKW